MLCTRTPHLGRTFLQCIIFVQAFSVSFNFWSYDARSSCNFPWCSNSASSISFSSPTIILYSCFMAPIFSCSFAQQTRYISFKWWLNLYWCIWLLLLSSSYDLSIFWSLPLKREFLQSANFGKFQRQFSSNHSITFTYQDNSNHMNIVFWKRNVKDSNLILGKHLNQNINATVFQKKISRSFVLGFSVNLKSPKNLDFDSWQPWRRIKKEGNLSILQNWKRKKKLNVIFCWRSKKFKNNSGIQFFHNL